MSCRCKCTAYGGHCDCWFDGASSAESKERAAIVEWLDKHGYEHVARRIENGEHRP